MKSKISAQTNYEQIIPSLPMPFWVGVAASERTDRST